MASPYILSERMMHMFDDLNVESYARFAYLELSRRVAALRAQLPHEAGEIVSKCERGRDYLYWKYHKPDRGRLIRQYIAKNDESDTRAYQAHLRRLEDELHVYEEKLYLAETALASFGLTPELIQQSAAAISPISFMEPNRKLVTLRGEEVRSKSELLIANILYLENIRYFYESSFRLGGETVVPDFVIPLKDGNYDIWEHLGLLEQEQYQTRWAWKKNLYTKNNYVENLNLIITKDTQGGFDTRDIQYMIQTYHLKEVAKPLNP